MDLTVGSLSGAMNTSSYYFAPGIDPDDIDFSVAGPYSPAGFMDVEKTNLNPSGESDANLCWAASASNMLAQAGWGKIYNVDNEDTLFDVFREAFYLSYAYGSSTEFGIEWFFTGSYAASGYSKWDQPVENSGGIYSARNLKVSDYLKTYSVSSVEITKVEISKDVSKQFQIHQGLSSSKIKGVFENVKKTLEADGAVGLAVGWTDNIKDEDGNVVKDKDGKELFERVGGHAITVWGYEYNTDPSISVSNPKYYSGLWLSDSDDDIGPYEQPNNLKFASLEWVETDTKEGLGYYKISIDGYGANAAVGIVEDFYTLAARPDTISDPYDDNTIGSRKKQYIGKYMQSNRTQILSGGEEVVRSGGISNSATIRVGGVLTINAGAMLSGMVEAGGVVNMENNSNFAAGTDFNFQVDQKTAKQGGQYILKTDAMSGFTGTITVSDSQENGNYVLARSRSKTAKLVDFTSLELEQVSNQVIFGLGSFSSANFIDNQIALAAGKGIYTLSSFNRSSFYELVLSVSIDNTPPAAPLVVQDIAVRTRSDINLTVTPAADAVRTEYSLDGGSNWLALAGTILMTQNGSVEFRSFDKFDNMVTSRHTVSNIDRFCGEPVVTVSEPRYGVVTVSAAFESDVTQKEYSFDGSNWVGYTKELLINQNSNLWFRAVDNLGNESSVKQVAITGIIPPVPAMAPNTTTPTNQKVVFSADFAERTNDHQYSLNMGKTWKKYKNSFVVKQNGAVLVRSTDLFGRTNISSYIVDNIDKVKPVVESLDAAVANRNAVLSWSGDGTGSSLADAGLVQLKSKSAKTRSFDSSGSAITLNNMDYGLYQFRVQCRDVAGNSSKWSAYSSFIVKNDAEANDVVKTLAIRTDNPVVASGGYVGVGDSSDRYEFALDSAGRFTLGMDQLNSKVKVTLFNSSTGKKIKSTSLKNAGTALNSVLLKQGNYHVIVESGDKGKGKYNTDYNFSAAANFFPAATTNDDSVKKTERSIALGETVQDFVGYGDASDAFKLTLAQDSQLTVGADGTKIELYDSAFKKVASGKNALTVSRWLSAGDYYVNVLAMDLGKTDKQNCSYSLQVNSFGSVA